MLFLIWLLLTIALACLVHPADKRHLAEKKVSWYLQKLFEKPITILIGDDY